MQDDINTCLADAATTGKVTTSGMLAEAETWLVAAVTTGTVTTIGIAVVTDTWLVQIASNS